jgi:hypothetical protein
MRRLRVTVRVDDLSSDVVAEGASVGGAGPTPPAPPAWEAEDAYRALRERVARDAERTRAEAYDD